MAVSPFSNDPPENLVLPDHAFTEHPANPILIRGNESLYLDGFRIGPADVFFDAVNALDSFVETTLPITTDNI